MTEDPADQTMGARAAVRESLLLMGQLSVDGGPAKAVRIRNLSATGLMAEAADPPPAGARATIDLRNIGTVGGVIAWARDGRFGMAFDVQISPAEARKPVGTTGSGIPEFLRPFRPLR